MNGEFADDLARSLHGTIREGMAGSHDDDLAFAADWGFGLDAFAAPVAISPGDQDMMVPFARGRWLAARIPAPHHLEPVPDVSRCPSPRSAGSSTTCSTSRGRPHC